MSGPAHPMASWLGDLEFAFEETARNALGIEAVEVTDRSGLPVSTWQGAYMSLAGPTGALQVGVAGEERVCQALARGLLGMSLEEPLPAADMADAVCEIVNIVAGAFKARVRDRAPQLTMGLPTFFRGGVQETDRTAVSVAEVRAGGLPAALLLVHARSATGA